MNEVGVWTISGHLTLFYKQVVCLNEMNNFPAFKTGRLDANPKRH